MIQFNGMKTDDKLFILSSLVAPVVIWWLLIGRNRYGIKGMR